MATKRTAKKAAAKPVEEQPVEQPQEQPEEQDEARASDVQGKFPLPEGHGFYTRTVSRRYHSGTLREDRPPIQMVQRRLGRPATGTFSAEDRDAVLEFQSGADLPATGIVDEQTWDALR